MASLIDIGGGQLDSLRFRVLHPSEWKSVRRVFRKNAAKHLSDRHGWTHEEIAKVLGVSRQLVTEIIRGNR